MRSNMIQGAVLSLHATVENPYSREGSKPLGSPPWLRAVVIIDVAVKAIEISTTEQLRSNNAFERLSKFPDQSPGVV